MFVICYPTFKLAGMKLKIHLFWCNYFSICEICCQVLLIQCPDGLKPLPVYFISEVKYSVCYPDESMFVTRIACYTLMVTQMSK